MILNDIKCDKKDTIRVQVLDFLKTQTDDFLKEAINKCPDQNLDSCINFLFNKAQKFRVGNGACVRDDVVFGWVKEYFIDYEARMAKLKEEEEKRKARREAQEAKAQENNIEKEDDEEEIKKEDSIVKPVETGNTVKKQKTRKRKDGYEEIDIYDFLDGE